MNRPARLAAGTALLALALAVPALGQERDRKAVERDTSLTVYSSADPAGFDPAQFMALQAGGQNAYFSWPVPGFGVVKEVRSLALPEGTGEVRITDVAQHIDPTTVSFADLDSPSATTVREQAFEFDLISPAKLIERYVDQEIRLREEIQRDRSTVARWTTGTVLSASLGQVVLRTDDGLRFINARHPGIRLPALPEGLITRPTLVWRVSSQNAGDRRVRTTYQTGGLTWRADYNIVLAKNANTADIGAWVTLLNLSGASYDDTRLKLVAGDVQRIGPTAYNQAIGFGGGPRSGGERQGFEEKAFFEYHLYTLPRRTDVPQNATKQIALFPSVTGARTRKVLVYFGRAPIRTQPSQPHTARELGTQSNTKVDVYVEFENRESNRLGLPLPRGKVRAYQRDDADGTLEFIGEDVIDHTPRDETVRIRLGQSFDVVGERTQADFQIDTGRRQMEEAYEVEIRNHKDEAVDVIVRDVLFRWAKWKLIEHSDEFEKIDSRTIHFPVTVPARGSKKVTYRVRYTW